MDKEISRRELLAGAAVGVPALLAAKRLSGLHLPESISGLYPAGGILSSPPTGSKPKRGGSLHIGVAEIVEDINPYKAGLYQWLQFVALTVYEPLVTYSGSGQVIPVLAESFEEPDEKTTTFHLRQGVTFHNGASFSADDVVAAFQNYNNPKVSSGAVLPGGVFAGIQKVNQYTVTVKTKSSFRAVDYLRWLFIPPKSMTTQQLSTQAVGTGPFIFESFTPGNQFVVKRNPQYWQSGQPYLDGITFEFLQNASIQIANLRSGEVDYLFDVPVNLVKEVQGGKGSSLVQSTKFFHWWDVQLLNGPLVQAGPSGAQVRLQQAGHERDRLGREGHQHVEPVHRDPLRHQQHVLDPLRPGQSQEPAAGGRRRRRDYPDKRPGGVSRGTA